MRKMKYVKCGPCLDDRDEARKMRAMFGRSCRFRIPCGGVGRLGKTWGLCMAKLCPIFCKGVLRAKVCPIVHELFCIAKPCSWVGKTIAKMLPTIRRAQFEGGPVGMSGCHHVSPNGHRNPFQITVFALMKRGKLCQFFPEAPVGASGTLIGIESSQSSVSMPPPVSLSLFKMQYFLKL